MILLHHVNQADNLWFFGTEKPQGANWESVTPEGFNALRSAGFNPDDFTAPHRVEKDTIMLRVANKGYGYVLALDDVLLAQPRVQQILWRDFAWFMSDNPNVRALITAIGLSPDEILASTS